MLTLIKLLYYYCIIAVLLSARHWIDWFRCLYIAARLHNNNQTNKKYKNQNYAISIESLLKNAKGYNIESRIYNLLSRRDYSDVEMLGALFEAQAVYRHWALHTFTWPATLFRKLNLFNHIFNTRHNFFIKIIMCFLEGFLVYLLGLYLDTTGIGNKILTYITDWALILIGYIQNL